MRHGSRARAPETCLVAQNHFPKVALLTPKTLPSNFSRPGAQIIAQYYNLIHLGFNGYRAIMENCLSNARLLSKSLEATGWYECVSDIHRPKGQHKLQNFQDIKFNVEGKTSADYNAGLPVVAFHLSDAFRKDYPHVKQETISLLLRAKQYIIPNYPLPPKEEKTEILRVVVRESMSLDLLDRLITDIIEVTEHLMQADELDLGRFQPGSSAVGKIEKEASSSGLGAKEKHKARRPMTHGVHRTVC